MTFLYLLKLLRGPKTDPAGGCHCPSARAALLHSCTFSELTLCARCGSFKGSVSLSGAHFMTLHSCMQMKAVLGAAGLLGQLHDFVMMGDPGRYVRTARQVCAAQLVPPGT